MDALELQDGKIVTIQMHNFLQIYEKGKFSNPMYSEVHCILYSARLDGMTMEDLMVISGTVFNKIFVWHLTNEKNDKGEFRMTKVLVGHEGVIFEVNKHPTKPLIVSVSDDRTIRQWDLENDSVVCSYGHMARVWKCNFHSNFLVSVSEDACCKVWDYEGNCLKTFESHIGKHVWSYACSPNEDYVLTGGGDGSIKKFSLGFLNEKKIFYPLDIQKNFVQGEIVRSFCLFKEIVYVLTTFGNVYEMNGETSLIYFHENLKIFCVMNVLKDGRLVLGDGEGLIHYPLENKVVEYSDEKIINIFSSKKEQSMFLYTLKNGLVLFDEKIIPFQFEYLKNELPTFVEYLNENTLLMGTRKGSIVAFNKENGQLISKLKISKDCITKILLYDDGFYVTERFGNLSFLKFKNSEIKLIWTEKITKGSLEDIFEFNNKIYLTGFWQKKFLIFNIEKHVICEVPCGGAHRVWSFDEIKREFYFIRHLNINKTKPLIEINEENSILVPSLHGREIRCICVIEKTENETIFATGSEECFLKLWKYDFKTNEISEIFGIRKHRSMIRLIKKSKSFVISAGGAEQLFLWKFENKRLILLDFLPTASEIHDVRIMDVGIIEKENSLFLFVIYSDGILRVWKRINNFELI
ncbi:WD40 repeat-like protein, partial [Rozella allomycis CSF55]